MSSASPDSLVQHDSSSISSSNIVAAEISSKAKAERVQRACDVCRRRKIKCAGATPDQPCITCVTASIACTFEERSSKRSSPKGYVESLEKRLETMESLIKSMSASAASGTNPSPPTHQPQLQPQPQSQPQQLLPSTIYATSERQYSASSGGSDLNAHSPNATLNSTGSIEGPGIVDGLADDLDMLELSVNKDRYVGRGSGLHLVRSVRAFAQNDPLDSDSTYFSALPSAAATSTSAERTFEFSFSPTKREADDTMPSLVEQMLAAEYAAKQVHHALPEDSLIRILVDAYFEHINDNLPLLHRPSFERDLASGRAEKEGGGDFKGLLFSVLALGARFVEDDRLTLPVPTPSSESNGNAGAGWGMASSEQARGWSFFRACYPSMAPLSVSSSLFDIQCSALCVMWLVGSASPLSAYAFVGFAMRRVIDVGAHREHRTRWTKSPLENQLRKRAFFTLFGMDRSISTNLGRPLALQDEDVDLLEPLAISDADLDTWNLSPALPPPPPRQPNAQPVAVEASICLAQLSRIMGHARKIFAARSAKDAASHVCGLDSMLNQWLEKVPQHLRWNPAKQDPRWLVQSALIYSSYLGTQILIHREFISPSRAALHSFPSLAICSNAARSTSHVLDLLRQRGLIRDSFMFAPMQAITSGLILLISVFAKGSTGSTLSSSALSDVKRCIDVLHDLSTHTFIAAKCYGGLSKLSQLAASSSLPFPADEMSCFGDPNMQSTAAITTETTSSTSTNSLGSAANRKKRMNIDFEEPILSGHSPAPSSTTVSSGRSPLDSLNYEEEELLSVMSEQNGSAARMSRTKATTSGSSTSAMAVGRRSRPSLPALPLTTTDLSHTTFRGYPTFASPIDYTSSPSTTNLASAPTSSSHPYGFSTNEYEQHVQQQPPSAFSWIAEASTTSSSIPDPLYPSSTSYPSSLPPIDQPLYDPIPLTPGTEALFNSVNLFASAAPAAAGPNGAANMLSPGQATAAANNGGLFGVEYPFTFQTGDVTMTESDDWGSGFNFETFSQSFVGSGMSSANL